MCISPLYFLCWIGSLVLAADIREKWKSAFWHAVAKGRRASLCIDEWEHGEVRAWSCWQALNIQLLHITPSHNLYPHTLCTRCEACFLSVLKIKQQVVNWFPSSLKQLDWVICGDVDNVPLVSCSKISQCFWGWLFSPKLSVFLTNFEGGCDNFVHFFCNKITGIS